MDIKSFITEDNHSQEYLAAVAWLDDKIGGQDDAIQVAWAKRFKNLKEFQDEYGNKLYEWAAEKGVNFDMFFTMVWYLLEKVYVEAYGYSSDKTFEV